MKSNESLGCGCSTNSVPPQLLVIVYTLLCYGGRIFHQALEDTYQVMQQLLKRIGSHVIGYVRSLERLKRKRGYDEEVEQLRLIKLWSTHFTIDEYPTYASAHHHFGINTIQSTYNDKSHALMVSYKRIYKHAWEMCKMVERERINRCN